MIIKYMIMLLILLISGCNRFSSIEKDSHLSYPNQTRSGVKYVNSAIDLSRLAWWKKLNDPQLNQLLSTALSRNNDIKSAKFTILQAQAELKAAQYAWLPTLDMNSTGFAGTTWATHTTAQGKLANMGIFPGNSPLKFRSYAAGFVPSYSVNILKNINNIKIAKASLAIQQALYQTIRLNVISQMTGAYFMLLGQKAQLTLETAIINDLKTLRQLEQARFKSGNSNIEAVIQLDETLTQEQAKLPRIKQTIMQTENIIHLLLDENPGAIAVNCDLMSLDTDKLVPAQLPSSVLKNRPDIVVAAEQFKMTNAELGLAYAAFFPAISLTSLAGEASLDLTHLLTLNTGLWISSAAASIAALNASAYEHIRSAKACGYSSYYDYVQTIRAAFVDVDDSLTQQQQSKDAYLHTIKSFIAAKQASHIARVQYRVGIKDYRTVLYAQLTAHRVQLLVVEKKAQLLDSIVQVYNAVAGGIETDILH